MTKRDSKLPNSAGVNRGGTMRKYLYELAEAAKGAAATAVEVTEAATATATEATKAGRFQEPSATVEEIELESGC
jgi:hypothetical protein